MARASDVRSNMQIVSIGELGGKVRQLKFDLNAFAELENRFGNIDVAMEALQGGSMAAIKLILWAGLLHEEVELDEHTGEPVKYNISAYQVGSWIAPNQLRDIAEKLTLAISAGLPAEEEEVQGQMNVTDIPVADTMATVVYTNEEVRQAKND